MTAKARLTYFKGKFLEVRGLSSLSGGSRLTRAVQLAIQHDKWDEWTTCFSVEKLDLPSNPFLGFSAHTGDVSGTSFQHFVLAGERSTALRR